jgi:hypothetical protein
MSEQRQQAEPDRMGESDHPQYRTPSGDASETPLSEEEGGPAEFSLYDGTGSEQVAALTEDEEGRPRQGTGATSEEAVEDARSGTPIGEGFNPPA